jgi:hypothetical protein
MEVEEDEDVVDMFVWYSRCSCGRRVDGVDKRRFEVGSGVLGLIVICI